ncbi:MAG: J domain-containing protein [Proteobacteria bacterium]|nr:J domain-containing protein [Pseudomonadota bacterium]MBU1641241.1 J domain-containing protein [Pseudomonadota bacterium]
MASNVSPPASPHPYPPSLYLAREVMAYPPAYFLRLSSWDERLHGMVSRQIFALGTTPAQYIVSIGEQGFYIAEELIERIEAEVKDAEKLLEELLYPFVSPLIRRHLERFRGRGHQGSTPVTAAQEEAIQRELHDFDRRRLHYLMYGAIDQSRLYQLPAKVARRVVGMSRDQREQYIVEQERASLAEDEIRNYLFAVFHLSRFFEQSYARQAPQMLESDEVDSFFIQELCALADNTSFWQGMVRDANLPEYLQRYLCLWVDYDYGGNPLLAEHIRRFMNDHRTFSFPETAQKISSEEYQEIFGTSLKELKEMSNRQLTRLYRLQAMRLHPDTGGDHEIFVRLTEAYKILLAGKKHR